MTEKEKKGQSPEKKETPDSTKEDYRIPDEFGEKFAGKTPAEVVEMYKNTEKKLGEFSERERTLKEENQAYKNWYAQQQSQQQSQAQQGRNYQSAQQMRGQDSSYDDDSGEDFWSKPDKFVDKRFDQRLSEYDHQRRIQDAMSTGPVMERIAKDKYPDAFEDVNMESLRQQIYGSVQSGAIHPDIVKYPEAWARAAGMMRLEKMGYKIPKAEQKSTPTQTEKPEATKRQPYESEEPDLDDTARIVMKEFNISKEEAMDYIKAGNKRRAK